MSYNIFLLISLMDAIRFRITEFYSQIMSLSVLGHVTFLSALISLANLFTMTLHVGWCCY